ncbi:hypothetical protein LXG23DRAFT_54025 [Yarrowia lipolytica]|jgi:pentatricopeptide repeat protein|uniref:Pentacotripeptide-repeat region of PRORP domain-containing protein n=1 Tax=Yarrowia lipolytica TaxID=4952 RepID=A0A1D8NJV0_YARLL|nr:hypothetical protein YALI1_E28999g [Yarrowia lipolytica]KAB8285898.1 hypothetical protein BKA91DRAFT_132345 [Yarrowia lipolytica]KAE8171785.1 hypothetical protein BKA90DRAFT_138471 [Yarrowia lipolytica]KAJ8057323.1 hypothetical protein LXG23DRAFT_54025 [Yarrowia lipolytica]RMI98558.1 hypothetical protein BD777DRAFT_85712 [Yarrowia lipolytica]
MLQRTYCGVPRSQLAPRFARSVTTGRSGQSAGPNYSDIYQRESAEDLEGGQVAHSDGPMGDDLLPKTSSSQQNMWRVFENSKDKRLAFVSNDAKASPYHSGVGNKTKNMTVQKNRKEVYERCKETGDATTAMQTYKMALSKGGTASLRQFDHITMMEMCLKDQNILMFLVFFAQTISVGDSINTAMEQVKNARRLIMQESNQSVATKLSLYTWCVAMQKLLHTCDLTQLTPTATNTVIAEQTLAYCVQNTRGEALGAIIKQSPFKGLAFSLIELFAEKPKIICELNKAIDNASEMSITTFGRVLVALTETGQYDAALKKYNDPTQTTLLCRNEYVDHVAVIYAVLGKWDRFCDILTQKYAQLESNTDSKSLAAVLARVREAGGGSALLDYVDQKAADLLPFQMVMCMAAGDYPNAAEVYNQGYKESLYHSSKYGRKLSSKRNSDSEKPVDPLLTHLLLQVYDHICEPQESIKILQKTPAEDITPLMLSNAIQACVGAYSRTALIRLMKFVKETEGVTQDVSVANAIIRALMRLGGWSEAVTVFNHLGIKVDINSYAALLSGLVYHRKYNEYSYFLTKLQRTRGLHFTTEIYGTIMQSAVAQGQIDKAEQLLLDLEKAVPKVELAHYHYQYLMSHYTNAGEPAKSTALYQRMTDRGIQPSGAITRNMLTNIKLQYDMEVPEQRKTALVVMEAAARDIVVTSDLLNPGVISPFVREAFWYIEESEGAEKGEALEMMASFLAAYTEKHGGSESMRVLIWVLQLESLKSDTDFGVAESCWQRLFDIADMRNARSDHVRGFRPTKTSNKHVMIMGDALEIYAKVLDKSGNSDKLKDIRQAFRSRRWRLPYSMKHLR